MSNVFAFELSRSVVQLALIIRPQKISQSKLSMQLVTFAVEDAHTNEPCLTYQQPQRPVASAGVRPALGRRGSLFVSRRPGEKVVPAARAKFRCHTRLRHIKSMRQGTPATYWTPEQGHRLAKGLVFETSKIAFHFVAGYATKHNKSLRVGTRGGNNRKSKCSDARCPFFIQLYKRHSENDNTWYVSSFDETHVPTCTSTQCVAKCRRTTSTTALESGLPALEDTFLLSDGEDPADFTGLLGTPDGGWTEADTDFLCELLSID